MVCIGYALSELQTSAYYGRVGLLCIPRGRRVLIGGERWQAAKGDLAVTAAARGRVLSISLSFASTFINTERVVCADR